MGSWEAMLRAYQTLPDDQLLVTVRVAFQGDLEAMISRPSARAVCASCGEEVFNDLHVERDGRVLCRACAGEAYYSPLDD